jgi:excinuclease ABC subunit C
MVGKETIKDAPLCPGVYLMKDARGQVIYVGKARSLKKRLASYFTGRHAGSKTALMLSSVCSIDHQRTQTEREALILESELIKAHKPRFNIVMKDDKSFPYLKLTHELYPRLVIGRKRKNQSEDVDYFGPYTNPRLLRQALKMLRKSFPFRSCRQFSKRACLDHEIGLCMAPCL